MSERYARQTPLIGEKGQDALFAGKVFVAGAGGLGSPVLYYLTAAGVGRIAVADFDVVDESNLNRQILHNSSRVGMPKVESAKMTLSALNPDIKITPFFEKIDAGSIEKQAKGADIIIDCMDNFSARYILNKYAQKADIPLVHGAVSGFSGQATLVVPKKTACLSCIFPNVSNADKTPVMGFTAGVIASIEAGEAIKYLCGLETSLDGKLLVYDGKVNSFETFKVKKSAKCKVCGAE